MANELKIVIDADVQKAVTNMKKFEGGVSVLEKQLVRLQKIASNTTLGFKDQERVAGLINKTNAELAKFQRASSAAVMGVRSLNSATGQSVQVLGNFSRIVQDAPFGILGIANNINPLIESFQRLQATAKATGTSLGKNLLGALTGPAGIGLAVGLTSSLLVAFGDDIAELVTGSSKLDKAIDSATESIDKEAGSVIVMVKALQSGTLSSKEFQKVKAELIAQAPEFQNSFEGDKISIEASDVALQKYIKQLTTTVRVTAALGIVNDTLAKSIRAIAKGEDFSFGEAVASFFEGGLGGLSGLANLAEKSNKNVQKAVENLKPENISKLFEDTFKKLGISFNDFVGTIDDDELKKKLAKIKADFEKFQNEVIGKARLFTKEFGAAFVVPDLEESFFKTKDQLFKDAKKLLADVKAGKLQVKIPVFAELDVTPVIDENRIFGQFRDSLGNLHGIEIGLQPIVDNFFSSVKLEAGVPLNVVLDPTLDKSNLDAIDKKLDLRKQFSIFGDLGLEEFNKIDFSNINKGIKEATKTLQGMMEIATTLNQAIGQGMVSAFNSVFDAILEGKNVFKALGQALKELVVNTIKAVAQMLILKAITNLIFPGGGGAGSLIGRSLFGANIGNSANFGTGGIGNRAFSNVITVNVQGQISGDQINLVGGRAANSQRRF